MKKGLLMRFLPIWVLAGWAGAEPLPVVAIQPLGPVKAELVRKVKEGIEGTYAVTVEVLPEKALPEVAYYKPRDRYKADEILDVICKQEPAGEGKIVALTVRDISTITDKSDDWGIMGLGQLGGRACVVSTYRLGKGKVAEQVFLTRFIKVVNHELGHTYGLDHCPAQGCLMQDKRGKVATVDAESGRPCAECSARLPLRK
ncbi:MAG: Zn-dependent protease [Verrucomicrobiaceae bacterium]|nr:MAG: Zn-dependent protease [Verrucomicrobiaceae bacterium]